MSSGGTQREAFFEKSLFDSLTGFSLTMSFGFGGFSFYPRTSFGGESTGSDALPGGFDADAAPESSGFGASAPASQGFDTTASPSSGGFGAAAPATGGFGGGSAFGSTSTTGGAVGKGSQQVPYKKTPDVTGKCSLISITAMPAYKEKSFEELRYEDCMTQKGQSSSAPGASHFGSAVDVAQSPVFGAASASSTPCRSRTTSNEGRKAEQHDAHVGNSIAKSMVAMARSSDAKVSLLEQQVLLERRKLDIAQETMEMSLMTVNAETLTPEGKEFLRLKQTMILKAFQKQLTDDADAGVDNN